MPDTLVHLHHSQLTRHPRNMRQRYPLAEVRRMALSQIELSRRGHDPCIHPIVVTPGPGLRYDPHLHETLIIVAGHKRHAGNAYLKKRAPLLNCIVRYYPDEQSMLADMRTENGLHSDPGALGWAINFKTALDDGVPLRRLVRESGKSRAQINQYLDLLTLTPSAQDLVDRGDLPLGAIKHLKRLADPKRQEKAARRFAQKRWSLKQIDNVVGAMLQRAPAMRRIVKEERVKAASYPAVPATVGLPPVLSATVGDLREAASNICAACGVNTLKAAEPAWHIALAAAGETCTHCDLRTIKGQCSACALPEMLSRVARQVSGLRPDLTQSRVVANLKQAVG